MFVCTRGGVEVVFKMELCQRTEAPVDLFRRASLGD